MGGPGVVAAVSVAQVAHLPVERGRHPVVVRLVLLSLVAEDA